MAAVDTLRGLTQDVNASMRGVLMRLRPGALDRLGLERALRQGPIQDLLSDAEVVCNIRVRGDVSALDDDAQSAIYRIFQEAANDCVRRAYSRRIDVRLCADYARGTHFDILLQVRYDVDTRRGGDSATATAVELPGIRDRVLALGGQYRADLTAGDLLHHVHFVRIDQHERVGGLS
jgi:glucose-6-phosphate-specific signal transduction histidine kinase